MTNEAIKKADHHEFITGGDSIIFSASSRYVAEQVYGSTSRAADAFRRIQILAAIGAVVKIPDNMVPESMQKSLKKIKKGGNAIQYYMLRPLDSLAMILNMERAIDEWNDAHGVLHSVSYNYLCDIYGSARADEIYVKEWSHAASEIYGDYGWMVAS